MSTSTAHQRGRRIVSTPEFSRALLVTAAILIAVDVVLVLITAVGIVLAFTGRIDVVADRLMVTLDWSYGEIFGYLKWMAVVVVCAASWRLTRSALYAGFGVAFCVLLLDDMLQLHERFGEAAVSWFGLPSAMGLRGQDFGELFFAGITGLIVVVALVLGFRFTRRQDVGAGLALLVAMAGLIFCGVVLDMVTIFMTAVLEPGMFRRVVVVGMYLFEDGGEMVFTSLITAIAAATFVSLRSRPDAAPVAFAMAGRPQRLVDTLRRRGRPRVSAVDRT